jgi:hypothetical protein
MRVGWRARWIAAALLCGAFVGDLPARAADAGSPSTVEARNGRAQQPPDPADADQPPKPATPAAPAPEAAPKAVGEFQPVLHAQSANITTCMDTIVGESASVIDSAHTAISSWVTAAPDDNLFVSIIGLSYANKAGPNGAAIILAAPAGAGKCKGETVQIYPLAQSCSAIQASLIKGEGRTVATLRAVPVVETKAGIRNVLIPSAGGGCVIVAVTVRQ